MRGSIKKRSDGSWSIVFDLPRDANGRRRQKRITTRGTRRDAEMKAAQILQELSSGNYPLAKKQTLAVYLDRWLELRRQSLAPSTWRRYGDYVESHKRDLGELFLTDLTPLAIEGAISKWGMKEAYRRRRNVSPRTVRHCFDTLKSALRQAVKWGLLTKNPCDSVSRPKTTSSEISALDIESLLHLFEGLVGSPLHCPSVIAACAGLRRGEVLGLRRTDCDMKNGNLMIRKTLTVGMDGQLVLKEPKTRKSRRIVFLPEFALEVLRDHLESRRVLETSAGIELGDDAPVFADDRFSWWHPDKFSALFYYIVRERKLPRVSFHGLRHTYASVALAIGTPLKVTSEALGHTTLATTADIYTHVLADAHKSAAVAFDVALRQKNAR